MTRVEEEIRDEENKRIYDKINEMNQKEKDIYLQGYRHALEYMERIDRRVSILRMWCPLPWENK